MYWYEKVIDLAESGDVSTLETFLEQIKNSECRELPSVQAALLSAAARGDLNVLNTLLQHRYAYLTSRQEEDLHLAFYTALQHGHANIIDALLPFLAHHEEKLRVLYNVAARPNMKNREEILGLMYPYLHEEFGQDEDLEREVVPLDITL